NKLSEMGVIYYRNPMANIVTIRKEYVSPEIATKYGLVPDNHANPKWYKIVLMEHVQIEKLAALAEEMKASLKPQNIIAQ
ncbi:MAG: hypothetical protein AAF927_33395, partial [Bacteroidota bacterium]